MMDAQLCKASIKLNLLAALLKLDNFKEGLYFIERFRGVELDGVEVPLGWKY